MKTDGRGTTHPADSTGAGAPLTLNLLGGFYLADRERELIVFSRKLRILLATLAVSRTRSCRRDALATLLWEEVDIENARASLRQALAKLRKCLGSRASALWASHESVGLRPGDWQVDVDELLRACSGRSHHEKTPSTGVFLQGARCDEPAIEAWLDAERQRVGELCLAVLDQGLEAAVDGGDFPTAIQLGLRSLVIDPLRESVHRQLMRLYELQGDSARALRQFRDFRKRLLVELGVPPEARTVELFERIRRARRLSPMHACGSGSLQEQERELLRLKRWIAREHERVLALLEASGQRRIGSPA